MSRRAVLGVVVVALILASAVGVVVTKHRTRQLYTALAEARAERAELAARHAQLQLEYSAWGNAIRVQRIATESLNMQPPTEYHILRGRRP